MISMYEKKHHEDLSGLKKYAYQRIERCPRKKEKTFCSSCPIHCYQNQYRLKIKEVMKFAGPRMLYKHPIYAIKYVINTLQSRK